MALLLALPAAAVAQEATIIADGETVTETVTLPNDGDSLEVAPGGTITTDGDDEHGVDVIGADANVTNNGNITTNGQGADGILSEAEGVTATNNGEILTTATSGEGIRLEGDNSTIINNGDITTQDGSAEGLFLTGNGTIGTNNGSVTTLGGSSDGVEIDGDNNNFANNGTISTSGSSAEGVIVDGNDASLSNAGEITTAGTFAEGVEFDGDNGSFVNSGQIRTDGDGSEGVEFDGDRNVLNNTGAILTFGDDAEGVQVDGTDGVVQNAGLIETNGAGSEAVAVFDDDATVINEGTMAARAEGVATVLLGGDRGVLRNSGQIIATGDGAIAIEVLGDDNSVTLNAGSEITGAIDFSGTNGVLNVNANTSSVLDVIGDPTVNVANGIAVVDVDGRSAFVDLTGHAALGQANAALAGDIHRGILTQNSAKPGAWGNLFGSSRDVAESGGHMSYGHDFAGALAGFDRTFGQTRLGLFGGAASGTLATDVQSYDADIESLFGGAYLQQKAGVFDLTSSVILGQESVEMTRFVFDSATGLETAGGTFDGQFASAALTAAGPELTFAGLNLRPSAAATYTASSYDSFAEDGSGTTGIAFDAREAQTVHLRGQLESQRTYGAFDVALRAGVDAHYFEADDISGTLGADTFSVAAVSEDTVVGGFIGARTTFAQRGNLSLVGDAEYRFSGGYEDALSAGVRMSFQF